MKISVVVPAFNEEKNILSCLRAIYSQRRLPEEVIVVDNNSTDNTSALVHKNFPAVRVVLEREQGIAAARDAGFRVATGDVVARTDADSLAPPCWIAEIERFFTEHPGVVAASGPIRFIEFPWSIGSFFETSLYLLFCRFFFGKNVLVGPNMAVRRGAWERIVPCRSNNYHEDVDLALHLSKVGLVGTGWSINTVSSARRIFSTPHRFFVEYPKILLKTFRDHANI